MPYCAILTDSPFFMAEAGLNKHGSQHTFTALVPTQQIWMKPVRVTRLVFMWTWPKSLRN